MKKLILLFTIIIVFLNSCTDENPVVTSTNHPPEVPSLISPSYDAVKQLLALTLSWSCIDIDGDSIIYNVYLDKVNPPLRVLSNNQKSTNYFVTNLDTSCTYYWKIIAKDFKGDSTSSNIGKFRTTNFSAVWDAKNEYSKINNPNGAWSYGRKWAPNDISIALFDQLYDGQNWWFGNWGHGAPTVAPGLTLWAKDNSNGLPCIRWTSPSSGYYNLTSTFRGSDSRGNNNTVFVTLNGAIVFVDTLRYYLDTTSFSMNNLHLNQHDKIDLIINWNGGIYSEFGWTHANALIRKMNQ